MKIRCESCLDVLVSTPKNRWVECLCKSVFIDGSYDRDGKQLLFRYGELKPGAKFEIREDK
jgi:hypothetical protein